MVELLVVLAVIGILSSIVFASMSQARATARDKKRVTDLAQIQLALKLYQTQNGHYPKEADGFSGPSGGGICTDCTNKISEEIRKYMGTVPEDPLYDSDNPSYPYRYYYDGFHLCRGKGTPQAVLMVRRMETEKYKNMVKGPCDTEDGNILDDYGAEGRGFDNTDAYYIILGPGG